MKLEGSNSIVSEHSRWHMPGIDTGDPHGPYASQRLRQPMFTPVVEPKFQLRRDDRLYAIGSCFAREIEKHLVRRGFQVESCAKEFTALQIAESYKHVDAWAFTDKYNTYSILNEVSWALDPAAQFPEASLVDLDEHRCIDPHIVQTLTVLDRAATLERRHLITEVTRRIRECQIVVLTLGLVEAWYDTDSGTHINSAPPRELRARYPKRYRVAPTNYVQNMENMERLHQLLTMHGHPELRIVVTTSPVPLVATFTGQDVVVANTYSKATLRAVAQDWAAAHDNVQYFPSYEVVMNSARDIAWQDDLRHVRTELVEHIIDAFTAVFVQA